MNEISDETRQALRRRCPTPEEVDVLLAAYEERGEAVALLRELIWAVRRAHTDTQSMLADRGDALLRRVGGSDE